MAALACAVLVLATDGRPASAVPEIGNAEKVVRDVFGRSLNKRMRAGQRLVRNQKVKTGTESAASLIFNDNSKLLLSANAEVRLDSFLYQPEKNLVQGSLSAVRGVLRFVSSSSKFEFKVRTRTATIGIRGTVFDVLTARDKTEVAVVEGAVTVASGGTSRMLRAGEVMTIGADGRQSVSRRRSAQLTKALSQTLARLGTNNRRESRHRQASGAAVPALSESGDLANRLYLDLRHGRVVIQMRPDLAPKHVARIKQLVRQGFYDNLPFHNVKPGFVAETGDPTGTGQGGSGQTIPAEFSDARFSRGTVGMMRQRDAVDSADSRFFICFKQQSHLRGKYTVWGEVIEGMRHVERLRRGQPPSRPDRILRLRLAADAAG